MPPIKNWKRIDSETYQYRPDNDVVVSLENKKGAVQDKRHSLWYGDLYYKGEQIEELAQGITEKADARSAIIDWMRENPEVNIVELEEEFREKPEETMLDAFDDIELDEPIPNGACIQYESCENITPGGAESKNRLCDECLSEMRENDRNDNNSPSSSGVGVS